jgi:hypothetical protein
MKKIYLFFCVIGTIFPYYFFISFLTKQRFDLKLLADLLFANTISTFFAVDFLIRCIIFLVFMFTESKKYNIKGKWFCLISLCTVGLSLAFPLFLYTLT